jgi:hypothetical protein
VVGVEAHQLKSGGGRRAVGEVQPDHRIDDLGLPGGRQMKLQDQIGSWSEQPGLAVDARKGRHAGRPTEKVSFGGLRIAHVHALEARLRIAIVTPA